MQDVEIGVRDDVGRYGDRQQERPVDDPPPGEVVGGDQPRRAGADRHGEQADSCQQDERVSNCHRQHERDQVLPQIPGAPECGERQRREGCENEQAEETRSREPGPGPRPAGPPLHQLCDYRSKPTLSTSLLAAVRWRATSASEIGSTLSVPSAAMIGMHRGSGRHRVLVVGFRVDLLRLRRHQIFEKPHGRGSIRRVFAIDAPEMLTCVPPPAKVGRMTLIAAPHFSCSGPPAPLRIRPT